MTCIVYVCPGLHTSVTVCTALEQECSGEYNTYTLGTNATIHQVTTMLATSKNVLFPGHRYNHLLTTGADNSTL